ncbi:diacetylchitobiose uptake system permease protein NgcG [Brucella sp. NBRC 12952]|uniref:carbohydrate ABC transporter permease n=1 Tax=Brucella TaxID=234 RepID=UPI0030A7AE84
MTANSLSATLQRGTLHILLIVLSLITLFPLLWMVTSAFTPNELIAQKALRFWPEQITLSNFQLAADRYPIWWWLLNSVVTSAAITLGKLIISLPAGYAFARMEFRGKHFLFWVVIATMSFPTVLAIIPTYIAVVKIQAFDTYWAMIIPSIPYIGFYVFYFRQSFRSLPDEMFEAARIDGCGIWKQFKDVAIPNVLPAIAALSVISFMGAWNIYLWGQLVLEDTGRKTLTTGIAMFADVDGAETPWGPLMATSLLSVLPVLGMFLLAQRYIVEAFSAGTGEK